MDESGEIIDNFAFILQQQANEKPNSVYKNVNSGNTNERSAAEAQNVISNVVRQIRQLQSGANNKMSYLSSNKVPKSPLVPVNTFQEKIMPLNQLQAVDQTAEAACIGVTQEFEMEFEQERSSDLPDLNDETGKDSPFHIIDISLKEPDPNKILESPIKEENFKSKFESQFDNCTQMLKECIEIEDIDQLDIFAGNTEPENVIMTQNSQERSPSPIFNVKSTKTKSKSSSPLVYNLECFEKFENIASSVVDDSMDKDTAKQLINSQIFGKELYLQTDKAPYFEENEPISPVIELNTDSLKIDRHSLFQFCKNDSDRCPNSDKPATGNKETISNESNISKQVVDFEDEILFSSDEEGDYSFKSFKDLPFTCVLETSFYEQESDILDKTMYVGFQTASNKTILVKTDSFSKAKNMFDDIDEFVQKTASITELVELKDKSVTDKSIDINILTKNEENTADFVNIPNTTQVSETNSIHDDKVKYYQDTEDIQKLDDEILLEFQDEMMHKDLNSETGNKGLSGAESKLNKIGFKTASNKSIIVSDAAFEKSKKMLQDIDFGLKDNPVLKTYYYENDNLEANIIRAGFTTASNKKIEISEKALSRIKNVFHDIDLSELPDKKPEFEVSQNSVKNAQISDFKTAAKKEIKISEKALFKAKSIFQDLENQNSNNVKENISVNIKHCNDHKKDIENYIISDEDTSDSDKEPPFHGFEHSKDIEDLLQEVFRRSQKIFDKLGDCGDVTDKVQTRSQELELSLGKVVETDAFEGFKMASNKKVIISEKALQRSQKIFQDLEKQTLVENCLEDNLFTRAKRANSQKRQKSDEPFAKKQKFSNDVKDPKKNASFSGFQTASYKPIQVSEKSIEKSRKLFEDINHLSSELKSDLTTEFKGFQTANNKTIKVSEQALKKSKALFADIDNNFETTSVEIPKFIGFQTASNKQVKVSEKALEKSRKLFEDIHEGSMKTFPANSKEVPFEGFQTDSNKEIKIPAISLENSQKLFEDINHKSSKVKSDLTTEFKGFRTANNKTIKVSEQALKKSKALLEDVDNNLETISEKTVEIPKFVGFQTASNKQVKISERALEKSRKLFQDIQEGNIETFSENAKTIPFGGFQTASNKEIKISAKSLEKSRKLLQDVGTDILLESNPKIVDKVPTFQGFQTASNKKVEKSQKSLEKSRRLFQDLDGNKFADSGLRNIEEIPKFKGFQTASNKEVKISEQALEKSKKIFQDLDASLESDQKHLDGVLELKGFQTATHKESKISENTETSSHKDFKFGGFQTANNKQVKISEKALSRTRKIFQNIITDCEAKVQSTNITKLDNSKSKFGFITANNNKVDVSKDSLLKSKALFQSWSKDETTSSIKQTQSGETIKDELFEINTEVINDFETTFKETTPKNEDTNSKKSKRSKSPIISINIDTTPKKSKRSGSPILSCPKAKKRKVFKIPYSQKEPKEPVDDQPRFNPPKINKESQISFTYSSDYKKIKNYTLKDLAKMEAASNSANNIDPYILNFDFENLLAFQFSGERNNITDSTLTITDLKNIFQNSVNQKLIPDGWLDIQLKLIIWKLISYEILFPKTMNLTCTARNVIDQLKYRYDKELYNTERPILRKIMEKDDVSTRTLVLCVVAISGGDNTSITPELILTDGWYMIKALTDKMLAKFVSNGKIKIGTKLLTHGAELVGSEQALSPWEDTSSIRLKLFGNSTRRARWDARLGCHGNAAILSHLSNVTVEGGKVPKLRVLVTRVYPPLYVDKFEDGSTVTRSERLEHLHQMKYESERQAVLDKIYEEVEKEVDQDSEDSESSGCSRYKNQLEKAEISKTMKLGTDTQFLSQITTTQKERLEEYNEKRREKIVAAISCKVQDKMAAYGMNLNRNVVTVFKIRVVDIDSKPDGVKVTKAMLSIWRPNEAITEVIKENCWIEILNVSPTAFRYSELQLSAGRQSIFSKSKYKENEKILPYTMSLKRTCYPIKDLVKNPTMVTDYNEIDTIGIIIQTDPPTKDFDASKQPFQNVYLADIDKNIISINFWGGLRKFGFENCLDTGQIVAGINLQKRAGNTRKSIPQYRVTEFSYFTKTPKQDIARKMMEELSLALSKIDRNSFCEECIRIKDNSSLRLQASENISPYRFSNMDMNSSKTKIFLNSPLAQKRNERDENLHLTGLDFESTFKQQDTQEYSPKILLRKRQIEQKMAKLKMYGEPPALSPIQIINKSKNAAKAYKSPLISNPDVSCSVANMEENLPNRQNTSKHEKSDKIDCSPVICLNRTYVKKCDAKPVKLNFSKNDESLTDHFAEEFDCSPPLSLE